MDAKAHLLKILEGEQKLLKEEGFYPVRHDEHGHADLAKIVVRKTPNSFNIQIIDPGLIDFSGLTYRIKTEPLRCEVDGKLNEKMAKLAANFKASEYFPIAFPRHHVSAVLRKKGEYGGGEEDGLYWFRKGPFKWNHLGDVYSYEKPIGEHAGLKGSICVWETKHLKQFIDLVLGAGQYSV